MMNILMIAPQPYYSDRGTPMNTKLMCQVLGEAGHKVDLLVFPTGRNTDLKNVRIIRLPNILGVRNIPIGPSKIKICFDFVLIALSFLAVINKKYEVFHGIEEGGFLAVLLGRLLKKPSIYDMDSSISEQLVYSKFLRQALLIKFINAIECWALNNASLIISVCGTLSEKASQIAPQTKVVQIEDIPIQARKDQKTNDDMSENLIAKYQLSGIRRVVYTGNLEEYQGIDLLIDAWKVVTEKQPSRAVKLIIVGGPSSKVRYYKNRAAAGSNNCSVLWVGERPLIEMNAWMELSDVLISPRIKGDNTPLKIYSYMLAGRPIVATRKKTHTQVLDESMAFLCDPEPKSMGQGILDAIEKKDVAAEKVKVAQKTVQKKYSYTEFQKKLLHSYASLAKGKN